MLGDMPLPAKFFVAFIVALALIGGVAWVVRRYSAGGLSTASARGRQARLGVIETAAVDSRRRLVLVRRDNMEHLIMVGGPSDTVIEANIVRAQAAATRDVPAQRSAEALGVPPTGDGMWPGAPEPTIRPGRGPERPPGFPVPPVPTPLSDELPLQPHPEPAAPRVHAGDRVPGFGAEVGRPGLRAEPPVPRPVAEPRPAAEPKRPFAAPSRAPEDPQATDRHLAAMAQQLEAALRRPGGGGAAPSRETPPPELPAMRRPAAEPRPRPEAREPRSSLLGRAMQAQSSASFPHPRAKISEPTTKISEPATKTSEPATIHADVGESAAGATNGAPGPTPPPSPGHAAPTPAEPAAEPTEPSPQGEGHPEASAAAEAAPPPSLEEEMANLLGRGPGRS